MKYNPNIHHRRSIRLKGYDYSQNGAYFITICVQNRECLFGDVVDDGRGTMMCALNEYGRIAHNELQKTSEIRKNVDMDCFIVMPNHIHAIIVINDGRGTVHRVPTCNRVPMCNRVPTVEQFGKPTSNSIPTIVRSYKSTVTKQINKLRDMPGIPIWQRNYYEHIIRNKQSYEKIQNYIIHNSQKWQNDIFFVNENFNPDQQSFI